MQNLRYACETVMLNDVEGDFIETGVWRGGAGILMKGILEAYGDHTRRVFVADSFAGFPAPNPENFLPMKVVSITPLPNSRYRVPTWRIISDVSGYWTDR